MQVFDFNIHLPRQIKDSADETISQETDLGVDDLIEQLANNSDYISAIEGANIMLFNENLHEQYDQLGRFINVLESLTGKSLLTQLLNFRHPDMLLHIKHAYSCGIRGIKFHSYVQRIDESDFETTIKAAKQAEKLGMFICIDASFGTKGLYKYDNLRLAAAIANEITKVPILILHSGGARVLEAMLIALDAPNVYIETSFSLPFYRGSSVEEDLAFAYRKVGCHRILYGSDHPYVPSGENIQIHSDFFNRHRFSQAEIDNIMYYNAANLLGLE